MGLVTNPFFCYNIGGDRMKYSPKTMQDNLSNNDFQLKKKFGQNFIIDENIINNIVDKAGLDKDTMVIEIGPGAGSLTYKLATSSKNVLCYEIDESLEPILKENLKDIDNVEIIFKDFLQADVLNDIKKYSFKSLYVVANLPYYITTPIIMKIIEEMIPVQKIVVMVQKEVGNRFKATPNSKDYNSLSVYLDYYYEISKLMDVSKHVFIPKPNVDSIVICFKKRPGDFKAKDEALFFKLVRDSFKQKRKTLRNNLKGYDLDNVGKTLSKYNLDLSVRAEALSLEHFIAIADNLGSE